MTQDTCPVSFEYVDRNAVRMSAFFTVLSTVAAVVTGNIFIYGYILFDFSLRAFGYKSPFSFAGQEIIKLMKVKPLLIDRAPKIFAAKTGFVFALTAFTLTFISPIAAAGVIATLGMFSFMECFLNFCMGCKVYSWFIVPLKNRGII
ncbi:DUF4395 domain-containing protein [Myxococcota bacterium]|nr:DUF4395 domain-containing protein [Myxococcota bacterium]MBU1379779.1 DUF4395 domain-containing protein [Myxococcota bacterium]MBU1498509.1 DUF4395 domain-containing protein [Myxococcota bacterium]